MNIDIQSPRRFILGLRVAASLVSQPLAAEKLRPSKPEIAFIRPNKIANVPLLTHEGKAIHFFDDMVKDKIIVINMMYADCEGICPLATSNLMQVPRLLTNKTKQLQGRGWRGDYTPVSVFDVQGPRIQTLTNSTSRCCNAWESTPPSGLDSEHALTRTGDQVEGSLRLITVLARQYDKAAYLRPCGQITNPILGASMKLTRAALLVLTSFLLYACGGSETDAGADTDEQSSTATQDQIPAQPAQLHQIQADPTSIKEAQQQLEASGATPTLNQDADVAGPDADGGRDDLVFDDIKCHPEE